MADILILTETDLRTCISLNRPVLDVVEQAFVALAGGTVVMPPILSMDIPSAQSSELLGEVDVKTAYIPGFEGFAIKVSPGFFNNPALGLPSLNGLMVVLNAQTGIVDAVLLDNGYLTDIRTAAAGGIAANHLAPANVHTAGVIGTGAQARLQIQAAHLVRPFEKVLVWGRDVDHAKSCAADLSTALGIPAKATEDRESLVAESQLVITTTPSRDPLVKAEWLHPNLHVTCMGSDQHGKKELEPSALATADLYVCDRVSQCEVLGELASAREAGYLCNVVPPELGQVITGAHPGRTDEAQITICDLTGTGAQDTAIATAALKAARAAAMGARIST